MKNTFTNRCRWCRNLGLALVLFTASLLPGCNDTVSNTPGVVRSRIIVTVTPNPVIGSQDPLVGSVSAAFVIKIQESNGLGGNLQFVNSTVFDPETGLQVGVTYWDSADLIVFVGTDRVDAQSELEITQTASYVLTDFRVDADLTVNVQLVDDNGNLTNQSVLVPIVPPLAE
jgi:hypothetical protein